MLLALIVRGVAFEFRSKVEDPRWRATWDWMIFAGSLVPALLWGVALANIVRGVPIDEKMQYVGGFFNLLNPYALLGGLVSLTVFTLHGAIFLTLRTTETVFERAAKTAATACGCRWSCWCSRWSSPATSPPTSSNAWASTRASRRSAPACHSWLSAGFCVTSGMVGPSG